MPAVKTRGLILSERAYQERDRIVTIFTEEEGKVQAIVKGARNPRSQLSAATRLFAWSDIVYWPGKGLARIQEADLIDPFYQITENLERMTLASYPLELIRTFYDENQKDPVILKLLVYYLYYLAHERASDGELLTLSFQLKLAEALGVRPDLTLPEREGDVYFLPDEGRLTNRRPSQGYAYRLRRDEVALLLKLGKQPIHQLKQESGSSFDLLRLLKIMNHFLNVQAEGDFKSFDLYVRLRLAENADRTGGENDASLQDDSHDDPSGRPGKID